MNYMAQHAIPKQQILPTFLIAKFIKLHIASPRLRILFLAVQANKTGSKTMVRMELCLQKIKRSLFINCLSVALTELEGRVKG
jgi:hypothetical protein